MADENASNQRVTNVLLRRDLEDIAKTLEVLPDMVDKLYNIDTKIAVVCTKVERNEEEIDTLRKRGNINDGLLALFTAASVTISTILGTKQ